MKKGLALVLSVLTLLVSIITVIVSVRTMKMVEGLKKEQTTETVIDASTIIPQDSTNSNEEKTPGKNKQENIDENKEDASSDNSTEISEENAVDISEEETTNQEQQETVTEELPPAGPVIMTDEEVKKRKEQQLEIKAARDFLLAESRTLENTQKIDTYNKMLIATNAYDFSLDNILFIGDSITAGVGSTPDEMGRLVGYPSYVTRYFQFENVWNNAEGGWLYSDFAGEKYSIAANVTNKINIDSDILIFFAGINDYICKAENKRFGTYVGGHATAGYCGQVSYMMDYLQRYFGDEEIFFVLIYPVNVASGGKYTDLENDHSLKEYMEAQRVLAEAHGFHVIDLYTTGVMDTTVPEIASTYLSDNLHPNDAGYQLLADHIAAELAFYFTQNS